MVNSEAKLRARIDHITYTRNSQEEAQVGS